MDTEIIHLLSFASESICVHAEQSNDAIFPIESGNMREELLRLFARRNGFYAFESALLVRPISSATSPLGIIEWNSPTLWKSEFKSNEELLSIVFFAEDIFGVQFCIKSNGVNSFNPETGEYIFIAPTLNGWAGWILEKYKIRTGWPLAHLWQKSHGPLKSGMRLLPKKPFVLGGQYALENLYELDDVESMRFRSTIANQLLDCPDGSKVVLRVNHN